MIEISINNAVDVVRCQNKIFGYTSAMKKSLLLSIAIHCLILFLFGMITLVPPSVPKTQSIKIKFYTPVQQSVKPHIEPIIVPQSVFVQPSKPVIPQKIVAQNPVVSPIKSVITPAPAVNTAAKTIDIPSAKPIETPMPAYKPAPVVKIPEEPKPDPKVKEEYIAYLRQMIDERKTYPKNAKKLRQMGIAKVKFTLLRDGTIKNVSLADSSGFELLDQAATDLLDNLAHVRAFPKEIPQNSLDLVLPIEYSLK